MSLHVFYKSEKPVFMVFYLQINVLNIYPINEVYLSRARLVMNE